MDQYGSDRKRDENRAGHVDPFETNPAGRGGSPSSKRSPDPRADLPDVLRLAGQVAFLAA